MPKANVDHTISGQGTADSTLDHSATTPSALYTENNLPSALPCNTRVVVIYVYDMCTTGVWHVPNTHVLYLYGLTCRNV